MSKQEILSEIQKLLQSLEEIEDTANTTNAILDYLEIILES